MKTIFTEFYHSKKVFEVKIPNTYRERLRGLKLFTYIHPDCAVAFKSPCTLHTFGMTTDIWLVGLNKDFKPLTAPEKCPPNSIIYSGPNACWIAEFKNDPTHNFNNSSQRQESFTKQWTFHQIYPRTVNFLARIFVLSLIALFFSTIAFASQSPLKLPVGESKEVRLDDAPRSLDISQPDVIDVQRVGTTNKILITALRSGTSKLTAHFNGGSSKQWTFLVGVATDVINSQPTLSSAALLRLAREIQRRSGLDTVLDNGRIVIFGQMTNETQFSALADLCLGREECLPRYSAHKDAIRIQTKYLKEFFHENGFSGLSVEPSIAGVVVRGSAESSDDLDKIRSTLRTLLSRFTESIVIDKSGEALIESQLTFFRMNMTQLTALGLMTETKGMESGPEIVKANIPSFIAQITGGPRIHMNFPDVILNALAKKGIIQQIARPTIVVASGGKGEVRSGGELLFQSHGQNQKFFAQNYGLMVTLQPKYIGIGRISQKIDIKISNPQSNPNPNAISGMEQSVLTTEISAKPNEQILLTRISQQVSGKSVHKIPLIGQIPLIGELFKSRELQAEETELWIALKCRLEISSPPDLSNSDSRLNSQTPTAHWLD